MAPRSWAGALLAATVLGLVGSLASSEAATKAPTTLVGERRAFGEAFGRLRTTNSAGRSGAYYLPPRAPTARLPLFLVFHGTGGTGAGMAGLLQGVARARGFAILAPDSRIAPNGAATWEVGDRRGEVTPDLLHARSCLDEFVRFPGVLIDSPRVLAAGFSGGASSAPYLATNDLRITAFAILHGGVFMGGFGDLRPRAWISTGEADPLLPPAQAAEHVQALRQAGFGAVTYRTFPSGHMLSAQELNALVDWWLGSGRHQ